MSRYYIETRYPNGFPEGAPLDYFDKDMAKEAIDVRKYEGTKIYEEGT